MMSIPIKPLLTALVLSALSLTSFTQADPKEEKVNLIATIANQPAFKPVTWEVYRIERDGKDRLLKTQQSRHAFTMDIKPGIYAAVATYDNQKKKRYEFTVKANTPRDLFVPID
ncbi:MAG: hypothetical protein WAQ53_17685 [Thiofilum sp.]|uniref:hypothetical protein n=1 Tax=Thiofilum sp. TaxID=2212733 RepID=UPI0025D63FAE|nr:hypothetical protein [Thiofilum sp.]MBK8452020.1 hypothetical protein [Thiofilum sp.]